MYQTITQPDPETWNSFVATHSRSHFLQSAPWGDVKADFGWEPQRVALKNDKGILIAGALILYRELPLGLGKIAYVPLGPLVDWSDEGMVRDLFLLMDKSAKRKGAVFMKIEPGYDISEEQLKKMGCRPSPHTIQPPRTIILDIHRRGPTGKVIDPEFILKRMNQMTRRNIRKSEKQAIQVRIGTREDVESFNAILHTTSTRQDFGVHVPDYYHKVFECFGTRENHPKAALVMASYTDEATGISKDLAGVFVFVCGKHAWYVYGASSNEERQRMASFAAQWGAIEWARERGADTYDMVGIPDDDEGRLEAQFAERNDGLWGVYRFKRGWGGEVVRTVGAWDRVYNPLVYWTYRTYLYLRNRENDGTE